MDYSSPEFEKAFTDGLDLALKQKLPCGPNGKSSCRSSKSIPHNTSTALTIAGDYFIKKYEALPLDQIKERKKYLRNAKKA